MRVGPSLPITAVLKPWARARAISLVIDAVDASEPIIALAREFSTEFPEIRFVAADQMTHPRE